MRNEGGEEQALLKKAGLRVTPQRLAIMAYMRGSKAHPSPEMTYAALKPANPSLSLNTVYQTLRSLEEAGLVQRVGALENVYRYDADVSPHAHLVCVTCGRVDDTNGQIAPLLEDLLRKGSARTDWDVKALDASFFGLCPDCRKAEAPQDDTGGKDRGTGPDQ